MALVGFEESVEVRQVAEKIIDEHHPHLKDAKHVIGFYERDGKSDWAGKAKKCTAFERHVTDYMLFVFINKDAWSYLLPEQKEALVDHELCHFSRSYYKEHDKEKDEWITKYEDATDPDSWSIREHDVEEFSDIIKRHGLWETGIENFAEAVREADYQMNLDDVNRETKIQRVK
jgi:Putative phage metallopeptidase